MAKPEKRPSWFKLFLHQETLIQDATEKHVGRALKAAMEYFKTREVPQLDCVTRMLFLGFQKSIDEAFEDFARDQENGKKGGRPRRTEKTPGYPGLPPKTEADADAEAEADAEAYTEANTEAKTDYSSFQENNKGNSVNILYDSALQHEKEHKTEAADTKPFQIPTVGQVEAYCRELGLQVDAAAFVDYYEAKGWMLGANPMRDWRAAVRSWNRRKETKHEKNDFAFLDHIGIRL